MNERAPSVVRVLNGRLAGTEKALPATGTVSIGHQFWQDVVVRDPATRGVAIDLALSESGAQITVLSGEATMLGSTLSAGQTALLPAYVPFSIGGIALAWGEADSARWTEASGLAAAVPAPPPVPAHPRDQAIAIVGRIGDGLGDTFYGWRAAAVAGVAVLLILAASFGSSALAALGLLGNHAAKVERALAEAGLGQLTAVDDPVTGGVIVSGTVPNENSRARVQSLLRDLRVGGSVNVQTAQELAGSTADVARIHGVKAQAKPLGGSRIELHTTALNYDQKKKLLAAIHSDVPTVGAITLRDDLIPDEDVPLRAVSDATKKISTVVAGDPSYIQTSDGARYFPGAMMPSGHRLLGIQGQTVVLEKNGRQTRLAF